MFNFGFYNWNMPMFGGNLFSYPACGIVNDPKINFFSSIFNFAAPRYDVFDNNIFGYTPSYQFGANPMDWAFGYHCNNDYVGFAPNTGGSGMFNFLYSNANAETFNYNSNSSRTSALSSPSGDFGFLYATRNSNSSCSANSARRSYSTSSISKDRSGLPSDVNYNSRKGKKLANDILHHSCGFTGYCAAYVKKSMNRCGLGGDFSGHAYQMPNGLKNNPNFKEISTGGLNLSSLPAGCILVYDRGVSGYSSKYGHTEITLGDGRAVSDGVTHNIRQGARVFVPV